MKVSNEVDWSMINNIVDPKHQLKEVKGAPLDPVRMAWPFKTEGELYLLSKWYREEQKTYQDKVVQEHIKKYGKSFL